MIYMLKDLGFAERFQYQKQFYAIKHCVPFASDHSVGLNIESLCI